MFNFFKRDKSYKLPEIYKGLLSKEQYNEVISISKKYFTEAGIKIVVIQDGDILIESGEQEVHCYLDNLVRVLSQNERQKWEEIIYAHFNKLKNHSKAYTYLYKDFEYAAQFLRVMIKPPDIFSEKDMATSLKRMDLPGTFTFLVLEFEDQFRYIQEGEIVEWGKSQHELFAIAINNTPVEEIEVKEYLYCDKFVLYGFFSGDFSASLMLNLENTANYSIGKYGSMIAIPTKGAAFTHPVESGDIMELIETLYPAIEEFHQSDPGSITTDFYWYYNEKFEVFPTKEEKGEKSIRIPDKLIALLNNQ